MNFAYGVTTVPIRRLYEFKQTMLHLQAAGFGCPYIFLDGSRDGPSYEREFATPTTCRYPRVGAYGNFALGLMELCVRYPSADAYVMFQDDILVCRNVCGYLQKALPTRDKAYYNLYASTENEAVLTDKFRAGFHISDQKGRGALALVFPRDAAHALLTSTRFVSKLLDARDKQRRIDATVQEALGNAGYMELFHYPSLVQHDSKLSTIGSRQHKKSTSFSGKDFDAKEYLNAND